MSSACELALSSSCLISTELPKFRHVFDYVQTSRPGKSSGSVVLSRMEQLQSKAWFEPSRAGNAWNCQASSTSSQIKLQQLFAIMQPHCTGSWRHCFMAALGLFQVCLALDLNCCFCCFAAHGT